MILDILVFLLLFFFYFFSLKKIVCKKRKQTSFKNSQYIIRFFGRCNFKPTLFHYLSCTNIHLLFSQSTVQIFCHLPKFAHSWLHDFLLWNQKKNIEILFFFLSISIFFFFLLILVLFLLLSKITFIKIIFAFNFYLIYFVFRFLLVTGLKKKKQLFHFKVNLLVLSKKKHTNVNNAQFVFLFILFVVVDNFGLFVLTLETGHLI